ncbi:MAG: EamA family transporter [Maritimibacter sp.]|nr:EamA family transporter [Maritimibacter sp.]
MTDLRSIVMGVAFAAMWGSAFSSARIIVADAPPLTALALRFLCSGLIGVGIGAWLGQTMRLSRSQWRATVVLGICQNALYLGLTFTAVQTIEASLAAIIASTMPLLVALGGLLVFGERISPLGLAGLVTGILGVAIIMGARLSGGVDPVGVGLAVLGVLSLTVATMAVRGAISGGNVIMIVGLQMLVGSAGLAVGAVILEDWEVTWSLKMVLAFWYTALVPGLAATFVWFWLVNRIGAVRAATFHFLSPFFGVTIAALLLGERPGLLDLLGVAVVMLGIWAVQVSRRRTA